MQIIIVLILFINCFKLHTRADKIKFFSSYAQKRVTRQSNACSITSENSYKVYSCADATLEDVSSDALGESYKDVEILVLVRSSIPGLPPAALQHLEALIELTISNSALSNIEESSFEGLNNLLRLNLSYNELDSLSAAQFQQLAQLQRLNLTSNKILNIHQDSLRGLDSLQVLDLSGNLMETLPLGLFKHNPMLTSLDLSRNRLNTLPGRLFFNLQNFQAVDLGNNKLIQLPVKLFDLVPNLSRLVLSYNNIRFLLPETFAQPLAHLELLRVDNNDLVWTNVSSLSFKLPGLQRAGLAPNPWRCPCISELMDWVKERSMLVGMKEYFEGKRPLCVVPPDFKDTSTGRQYRQTECERPSDQQAAVIKNTYQIARKSYEKTKNIK